MNRLFALSFCFSLILIASARADTATAPVANDIERPSSVVVDCVLENPSKGRLLSIIDNRLSVFSHPCSGGLYLLDSPKGSDAGLGAGTVAPVVQGWFFQDSLKTRKLSDDAIRVSARFLTGVGPKGYRPFHAVVVVKRVNGQWQVSEPQHRKDDVSATGSSKTVFLTRAHTVQSQQELDRLSFCRGQKPVDFDVDFSFERLFLATVYLNSGKIRLLDPQAFEGPDGLWLRYTHTSPDIVSRDTKQTIVWYVLPKNEKSLGSGRPPSYDLLTPLAGARGGVIDRCRFHIKVLNVPKTGRGGSL